jgi:hypothetical protein
MTIAQRYGFLAPPDPGRAPQIWEGPRVIDTGTARKSPALEQAARELQAARHDARVALGCIALGDVDRAHTHALTARVAVDAAVTALMAVLTEASRAS